MVSAVHRDPIEHEAICLRSCSLSDTQRVGSVLANTLQVGDLVCIHGTLGAGKSELCRAIVRARFGNDMLEVPSPSYTLVNVYDHPSGEIWHADLYRIGDESELDEIGLEDAVATALVLLEWPERWSDLPERRLDIEIKVVSQDERLIILKPVGQRWTILTDCLNGLT